MNVLDLIAREHVRLGGDLQQYADEVDPEKALRLARSTLARLRAYLVAEERCVLPALISVAGASTALRIHHQHLKNTVAEAKLRSYRHDTPMDRAPRPTTHVVRPPRGLSSPAEPDLLRRAMLMLQQHLEVYTRREDIEMGTLLRQAFSGGELRLLGGEMLMELAARRRPDPALRHEPGFVDRLTALWVRSTARKPRRHRAGNQALPILREALSPQALHRE